MEDDATRALLMSQDRVTSLRLGMVEVIAKLWPEWLHSIEEQLGKRLSEIPDNILLAYLAAAASIHSTDSGVSPTDMNELERALRDCGIPVKGGMSHANIAASIRSSVASLKSANAELTKQRNEARRAAKTGKPTDTQKLGWAESSSAKGSANLPFDLGNAKSSGKQQALPGVFDIDDMDLDDLTGNKEKKVDGKTQEELVAEAEELLAVPQDILKRIRMGVKTTTPRFMSDIVSIADSADVAEVWEKSQRRGGGDVSFINAQDKHRSRGALIVPKPPLRDEISGFGESPWGRALEFGYRGGRLFDVATVLRKLGPAVVAVSFKEYAVEVIVSEAQGHYGLVVALSDGGEWYDTGGFVQELAVDSDVSKVVIVECQSGTGEVMAEVLKEMSQVRNWRSPVGVMRVPLGSWLSSGISRAVDVPLGR